MNPAPAAGRVHHLASLAMMRRPIAAGGLSLSEACDIVEFGPFRLDTARRHLTRDGQPVPLSSRAFDILALLVEHRDRVMTKDEIITRVWRGIVVEENNLAVQVSALRRALAEAELEAPLILTVPGQGYRFVGRVTAPTRLESTQPETAPPAQAEIAIPPTPAVPLAKHRTIWLPLVWPATASLAVASCFALYLLLRPVVPPPTPAPALPPRLSIAVLPFRDLSDDRCCAYLADAVSDDLTTDLSHIPGSVVIARESSDMYRDKKLPTADIGHALNVRYLLEGSLRAVEGNLSINAQLIEAATGGHLWAEHFTVPRNHLGAAQDAVVHRLASALGVTLMHIEGTEAARERGSDPDALDLFFQARSIMDRSDTVETMTQAQRLLEQAVAKQPGFSDALGELALLLARKVHDVSDPQATSDLAEARSVGADALRAAPNSGLAIAARGITLSFDHHWTEAKASLQAALAIEPESVPIRSALISCLSRLGEYEAQVTSIKELLRIDPEGPDTLVQYFRLGVANVMLGRPAEGLDWLTRATVGQAEPGPGADELGMAEYTALYRIAALELLGRDTDAHTAYDRYRTIWPNRTAWQIGAIYTRGQASLPGFARFIDALAAAGMPRTVREDQDWGLKPVDHVTPNHGAFEPTPTQIAGIPTIYTAALRIALAQQPPPRIVNLGSQAVTIDPETVDCHFDPLVAAMVRACAGQIIAAPHGGQVVVMGLGATDWNGYNGALALAAAGVREVVWYRGGEEAWAAAGGAYKDSRP